MKGAQRSVRSLCIPGGELFTGQLNCPKVSMELQTCPCTVTNGCIHHGEGIKGAKPEDDYLDGNETEADVSGSKVLITSDL